MSDGPNFVELGSSGRKVCQVCLGTMTFGSMSDEATAHAILDRYVALGGDFLDVAEMYPVPCKPEWCGASEEIIGRWLAARSATNSALRASLFIATKVAGPRAGGDGAKCPEARERTLAGASDGTEPKCDFSDAQIRRACDASLKRLQTTYVDLYQLHWPERYVPKWGESQYTAAGDAANDGYGLAGFDAVVATIGALIAEGKVRHWGVSNETTYGLCQLHAACVRLGVPPPVSIQNDFSLCFRTFESELAEACSPRHLNVGLLAYGVLNGGALSGKYLDGTAPKEARFHFAPTFQPRYRADATNAAIKEYVALAKEHGMSGADLAQAWAYSRWYMGNGAVIIGATSLPQLEANWKAACLRLPEAVLRKIDEIHVRMRNPNLHD